MYIIIGGTGFLGTYMTKAVLEMTDETVLVTGRSRISVTEWNDKVKFIKCDVSNRTQLDALISEINSLKEPCKIIYLSACHNPEQVEQDPLMSWTVNVLGLNYLLKGLHQVKTFVFASSEAVYGESVNGYRFCETDRLNPTNLYGIQKLAGEEIIRHYEQHSFRYALLTGRSLVRERKHFFDVMMESLSNGKPIELFSDSYRCMLDFETAASLTIELIERYAETLPPVLNISGDDPLSKYDIGMMIAQKYHKEERLITPICFAKDQTIFIARRAATILADNSRMKELLGLERIAVNI